MDLKLESLTYYTKISSVRFSAVVSQKFYCERCERLKRLWVEGVIECDLKHKVFMKETNGYVYQCKGCGYKFPEYIRYCREKKAINTLVKFLVESKLLEDKNFVEVFNHPIINYSFQEFHCYKGRIS